LNVGSSCKTGEAVSFGLLRNGHGPPIWSSPTEVFGLWDNDGSIRFGSIFHVVSELVATALKTQRPSASQTNMEHKIIAILRRPQHLISYILWKNRRPEMEPGDHIQDGLVIRGDLEGGYVDEARNKKFVVERGWGLVVSEGWPGMGRRVCLQDEIVERLSCKPGRVGLPLAIGLEG